MDLEDHFDGSGVCRDSLGIFSSWLSRKLENLPGVDSAVTSTKGMVLSILQGV